MMTNYDYDLKYQDLRQRGRLRFNPTRKLTWDEYEMTVVAITARLQCHRLPRLNEAVLVRTLDQALFESLVAGVPAALRSTYVVAEGDDSHGRVVEVLTADGDRLTKSLYRATWWFAPGAGPKRVGQEVA